MIRIKMFPAKNGDSFLIQTGTMHNGFILIDGGYSSTFTNYIKPELMELNKQNYKLGLAVNTHIDEDHIKGIIKFVQDNGVSTHTNVIPIENFWHNSLRSITDTINPPSQYSKPDKELLAQISTMGYSNHDTGDSEISARQGSSLAKCLVQYKYNWNSGEGYQSINTQTMPTFSLKDNEEVVIKVLSPTPDALEQLRDKWKKDLKKLGFAGNALNQEFDDGFEFLLSKDQDNTTSNLISSSEKELEDIYIPDTSITNRSSISIIIEHEGKRLLFLGDSWSEDIESSLTALYGDDKQIIFDAIKVSHHGSLNNTSPSLLSLVDSPLYFISTNGKKHNHPDMPLMKAIVKRPSNFSRKIYFSEKNKNAQSLYVLQKEFSFEVIEQANEWIHI